MSDFSWKVFERRVAEVFSVGWCDNKRALIRMPLQGRRLEQQWGDLIPNNRESLPPLVAKKASWFCSEFYVDCKNRKAWSLLGLLTASKHPFWLWWKRLLDSCPCGKRPLMVLKEGRKIVVAMDSTLYSRLVEFFGGLFLHAVVKSPGRADVFFCELERLISLVDPVVLGAPKE